MHRSKLYLLLMFLTVALAACIQSETAIFKAEDAGVLKNIEGWHKVYSIEDNEEDTANVRTHTGYLNIVKNEDNSYQAYEYEQSGEIDPGNFEKEYRFLLIPLKRGKYLVQASRKDEFVYLTADKREEEIVLSLLSVKNDESFEDYNAEILERYGFQFDKSMPFTTGFAGELDADKVLRLFKSADLEDHLEYQRAVLVREETPPFVNTDGESQPDEALGFTL